MLKEIKERVKVGTEAARSIRTIRETKNGQMLIVVEKKDTVGAEELRKHLSQGENIVFRDSGRERVSRMIIRDIDSVTSGVEVMDAIIKETGITKEECKMGEMRPCFGGNKAVTVQLEANKAKALAEKGSVRIGLSLRPVHEKVNVPVL